MEINSRTMLRDSLALLLAVRCQQEEAARQLLAEIYQKLDENKAKSLMVKTIYLLSPKERDWLRDLA
jgi:Arc/MetJ-type ribon-helix-helix transcriptional regulator